MLAESATSVPVLALVDHDDMGRSSAGRLEDFGWRKNRQIISLSGWPGRCSRNHDVEIEDLLPPSAALKVGTDLGDAAHDQINTCGSDRHYKFSKEWKEVALQQLPRSLRGQTCEGMVWLAEEINRRVALIAPSTV